MNAAATTLSIQKDAPIPTWFGVGGRADAYAEPSSIEELADAVRAHATVRILGDGANLLVDDDGVDGLVISLRKLNAWRRLDDSGLIEAEAGANLPKLIVETARDGLAGLEGLGGIPASVGGAVRMNAGGALGEIADVVRAVRVMDRDGRASRLERHEIDFTYRRSGLDDQIVLTAEFALQADDTDAIRRRLKDAMAHKKHSQPLAENSAGCAFKNPTIEGERVSAGRLIDEAGCRGMREGGASVSDMHANFVVTEQGCTARDILALLNHVESVVFETKGVRLEREIVVWRRGGQS